MFFFLILAKICDKMKNIIGISLRRMLLLWLFLWGVLGAAFSQSEDPVVKLDVHLDVKKKKAQLVFRASIQPGWHIYGVDVPEGGPTPTQVTFEQIYGLEPSGTLVLQQEPIRTFDAVFGMEVPYIENEATFIQSFDVTNEKYVLSGYFTYGACNDENCIPPTKVEFSFNQGDQPISDGVSSEDAASTLSGTHPEWWAPAAESLSDFSVSEMVGETSLWHIFFLGFVGGLLALLTPCVWPIIPMTVSFFLKRSQSTHRGILDASIYGFCIVIIYVTLGLIVTLLSGASTLNSLSTNAFFNLFFFLMLLLFAASFLGGFDLTLPDRWSTAVNNSADRTTGFLSIFLMAFTLSLVSFSCTGPIVGFLLVEVSTMGRLLAPAVGMFGFALALALPFTFFALFPAWLKNVPKSGNWMNLIKVTLGFVELAFALKFFSVADLAYGWHLLDREVFLSVWIVLFALLGAYFIGWIRFSHDEDEYDENGKPLAHPRIGVIRFFLALFSFAFSIYMVPGLWGAPCRAISAFAPPMDTQDFNLSRPEGQTHFTDYEEGMAWARSHQMPVMLDFTGYGCVNCRKMEASVWRDSRVSQLMSEHYVLITLHVDDKTPLANPITINENGQEHRLRTVGDKWSFLQRHRFGANAQPFYVLLDDDGTPLTHSYSYNEDVEAFCQFLREGYDRWLE